MKITKLLPILFCILLACASHQEPKTAIVNPVTEEEKFNQFLDSLKQAGSSELNTANEIRRYLAARIDFGVSKDSLSYNYYKIPWDDLSPFYCIDLFKQNRLTAKCGLTSYILAKLYNHAGYNSYIYNCGYDSKRLTHEFVLVKLNGDLIVEDAFYDITITDRQNNPKDFLHLLSEIKSGNFSDIKVVQDTILCESWLNSQAELDSLIKISQPYNELYKSLVKEVVITDNRLKIMIDRNYTAFTTPALAELKPLLKEDGLPENYLAIYLKPLNLTRADKHQEDDSLKILITSIVWN